VSFSVGRTRRTATYEGHAGHMGETPAHQVTEHLLSAVKSIEDVLLESRHMESKDECLKSIDQALAWLAIADIAALDRRSRWIFSVEMEAHLDVIERWCLAHQDDDLAESIRTIEDVLWDISWDLYASYDHWMRLNEDGLISDDLLQQRIKGLHAGDWRTLRELPQHVRDFRTGVAALPVA